MFKRVFTLASLLLLFGLFDSVSSSFAKETTKEDNVEKARNYIENNVIELNEILTSMKEKQEDYDLQEIQAVIDNYYAKNAAPKEVLNDKNLSIDDVFPLENEKHEAGQEKAVLNFEELLSHAKENKNEGDSIYEFSNKDGIVTVYVSKTGEVMILDDSVRPIGAKRTVTIGGYKYPEVYTRV